MSKVNKIGNLIKMFEGHNIPVGSSDSYGWKWLRDFAEEVVLMCADAADDTVGLDSPGDYIVEYMQLDETIGAATFRDARRNRQTVADPKKEAHKIDVQMVTQTKDWGGRDYARVVAHVTLDNELKMVYLTPKEFIQGIKEGTLEIQESAWDEFPVLSEWCGRTKTVQQSATDDTIPVHDVAKFLSVHGDMNVQDQWNVFIAQRQKEKHPQWEEYQRLKQMFGE